MQAAGSTLYEHETGFEYSGATPFLKGGPIEIAAGDYVADCFCMIPDEKTVGDIEVTVCTRLYPNDEECVFGPYPSANPMGVRFSGRQAGFRFDAVRPADFRIGSYRADIQRSGMR